MKDRLKNWDLWGNRVTINGKNSEKLTPPSEKTGEALKKTKDRAYREKI